MKEMEEKHLTSQRRNLKLLMIEIYDVETISVQNLWKRSSLKAAVIIT